MQWANNESQGLLEVKSSTILDLVVSNQFLSCPVAMSGEGDGTPLQYSCLENPMDRGAWWAAVHGVAKSWTRLSNFTFTFHFHALEKEMATHSSVLAWRIPGMVEPGGLPSMGSQSWTRLKRLSSSSSSGYVTAGDDWSHDIKGYLLPGRKAMTNLDSILKSRDITLPTLFFQQS